MIRHVPAGYTTITAALAVASSGDTIVVAAGSYEDDLNNATVPAGVILVSAEGAEKTIITPDLTKVLSASDRPFASVLGIVDGFKVTNYVLPGSIIASVSGEVKNCTFVDCSCTATVASAVVNSLGFVKNCAFCRVLCTSTVASVSRVVSGLGVIRSCTFYACTSGAYIVEGLVSDSLFYGNTQSGASAQVSGSARYCLTSDSGEGNIAPADPHFLNAQDGYLRISTDSICAFAGEFGRCIGAYQYQPQWVNGFPRRKEPVFDAPFAMLFSVADIGMTGGTGVLAEDVPVVVDFTSSAGYVEDPEHTSRFQAYGVVVSPVDERIAVEHHTNGRFTIVAETGMTDQFYWHLVKI